MLRKCLEISLATKLWTKVNFVSVKKIGERTNILKQQAFTLCQIKPNQILPPEMQKTDQSILPAFLLCLKRNDPQTFKSGSCKKSFLQCVYYWYNLLR